MHTVTQTTFRSDALAKALPLSLVVPDGDAPVGGWPLVLLLHGRGRDHRSITAHARFSEWFAGRRFALVCPHGEDGWWIDSPVWPASRYQSMLVELLAHVRTLAPISRDPNRTGVMGWSMGGYGATRFATDHPELIAALATIIGLVDFPVAGDDAYSPPALMGDAAIWPSLNPANKAEALRGKAVLILAANRAFDFHMNVRLHERLARLSIPHRYEEYDGEHHITAVEHAVPIAFEFMDARLNLM